jgi:two-component system, NtrC family, sensor kinase
MHTFPQDPASISYIDHYAMEESDKRILIVDDEEPIRRLFSEVFNSDYTCVTASNAEEAILNLEKEQFALVITDVRMPGLNGIELLREIVGRFPDTAVVIVSGVDRTQRVLDAVRLGAYDYLIKPCELDVLQLSVERALERRTLLRMARKYKQDLEKHNKELASRTAELERLQAQLVHSEKMISLGQLTAGIAHEINNPASAIYGNMEFLREFTSGVEHLLGIYKKAQLPPELEKEISTFKSESDFDYWLSDINSIISDCSNSIERITDVVQSLRVFSRLDEAEFKKVNVHQGIDSTICLISHLYQSRGITLYRDYENLPLIECYAGQLNQVWMNILINAAQAIDHNGEVKVSTKHEDKQITVSISDSGCGIAPEHMSKIFDPFFTTRPVGEGKGLGLSISYSIIKRHKGIIKVESQLGKGTTFMVTLPIDANISHSMVTEESDQMLQETTEKVVEQKPSSITL